MNTDPIADFFTSIRNAAMVNHATVRVPHSKTKAAFCRILEEAGFIKNYSVIINTPVKKQLKLTLKYRDDLTPAMTSLRRISKCSKRIYVKYADIPKPRSGFGIVLLSTNHGILTGKQARLARVGGELIGEIY